MLTVTCRKRGMLGGGGTCPRCSEYLCPRKNKARAGEGAFQTHVAGQLLFLDIWKRPFRAFSHLHWVKAMNLTNMLFYLCEFPPCPNRKRTKFFFTPYCFSPVPSAPASPGSSRLSGAAYLPFWLKGLRIFPSPGPWTRLYSISPFTSLYITDRWCCCICTVVVFPVCIDRVWFLSPPN